MIRKGIAAALAAWAALGATGAYAAEAAAQPCFTPVEAESIVTLLAPASIRLAATICRPTLGTSSYFATRGEALAERFDAASGNAWPVALLAVRKISGMNLPDSETVKPLLMGLVGAVLASKIKPEGCREIDRALLTLDPLPARNMAQLLVQFIQLRLVDKPIPNFSICRSQS